MSRSRRKPYVKDSKSCKIGKTLANRTVRRVDFDDLGSNSNYKKHYCRYKIFDYRVLAKFDIEKYKRK